MSAKQPSSSFKKKRRKGRGRERHLSVRSELRKEPDLNKIARAVIALAVAQIEQEAAADAARRDAAREIDERDTETGDA